ncbi:MAG: transcription antitermination factor NusB [Gemmatimonadetes bacterium]|nr:transcription antitermination factor NusB [Gemmatimonadota bacterium]NIR77042.1 transcription antitermination factor NusB [Gemmatimonadota bacterium]NIT88487.1 transcription antitermination factor NusB [Gemmatimonadota bacterium]NIU32310.1 transcription antitermination factor NusB [Gemmatimonadota bacterium]NIU34457.1 transcription antitermination factor NusB [Gemmatimonadota bacterium]
MSEAGGGRPHVDRSRARAWALNVHYRREAEGSDGSFGDTLARTLESRLVAERRRPHLERIVNALDRHREEIDRTLEEALDNWRLDRLSSIDRGVLRIAVAEMLHLDDVPPKVALQEAIRLAERYGGDESARFVNGVLDAVLRSLPARS